MASLGAITKGYVSALDPNIDTRENDARVNDLYRENELTDILTLADRKMPIQSGQPTYGTWVNEDLFKIIDSTGATVLTSGTPQVTTTATAATSLVARKADLVIFPNNVVGQIQSVTTSGGQDTIVIKSVGGGNITHTAGQKLSLFSIAMGERSDAPTNLRFGVGRYLNKWQIFSETSQITDVQMAAVLDITINGERKWTFKDAIDKKIRLKGFMNAAFWAGDLSATTFTDASPALVDQNIVSGGGGGGGVQTTRGIDKYIASYGVSTQAATLGAVDFTDINAHIDAVIAVRGPSKFMVVGSSQAIRAYSTFLKGLNSSGVNSVRLVIDGNDVNTSVDRFTHSGKELNFSTMPIFDHPTLLAYTTIPKHLYWIPYDNKVQVYGGGEFAPAIRQRYIRNQGEGNEMIGESYDGAWHPVRPQGTVQEAKTVMTTRCGIEVLTPQFFSRQRVIA